ncbi:MAG TPA: DUF1269 domain-containing protein [Solirubrobacter sp.]
MSENIYVLAASYDSVDEALADYAGIDAAFSHVGTPGQFDAIVIAKGKDGEVDIVRHHDDAARQARNLGLGWGLAAGMVAVLFPAVGILGALAIGGGTGATIGTVAKHASRGLSRDDLKQLGDVLDRGDAGLVVLYGPDMADRVTTGVSRATSTSSATTDLSIERVAAELASDQRETAGR